MSPVFICETNKGLIICTVVPELRDEISRLKQEIAELKATAEKPMELNIRLERNDDIPAFGGFLRCECQGEHNHVILLNVRSCMAPSIPSDDETEVEMTREDRMQTIISSLMHEFGHVLESHFNLPVNEVAIEKACMDWENAYSKKYSEKPTEPPTDAKGGTGE